LKVHPYRYLRLAIMPLRLMPTCTIVRRMTYRASVTRSRVTFCVCALAIRIYTASTNTRTNASHAKLRKQSNIRDPSSICLFT